VKVSSRKVVNIHVNGWTFRSGQNVPVGK